MDASQPPLEIIFHWCRKFVVFVVGFNLMRYTCIFLVAVTVALVGCSVWQMQQRNASPDVHVIGGEVYDGGTVMASTTLTHTFRVENLHSFAVNLDATTVGCACTATTTSASIIPPHGVAEVTLHVEPEDGKFSGSASIVTTHMRRSTKTLLFVTANSLPSSRLQSGINMVQP